MCSVTSWKYTPTIVSAQKDTPITVSVQENTPNIVPCQRDTPSTAAAKKDTPSTVSVQKDTVITAAAQKDTPSTVTAQKDTSSQIITTEKTMTKTWVIQIPKCYQISRPNQAAMKDKKGEENCMSDLDKDIEIICKELRDFGSLPKSKARQEDLLINKTVNSSTYKQSRSRSKSTPPLKILRHPNDTNPWKLTGSEELSMEMTAEIWNMSPEGKPETIWDTCYTLYTPAKYIYKQDINKTDHQEQQPSSKHLEEKSKHFNGRPDVTTPTYVTCSPRMTSKVSHGSQNVHVDPSLPVFSWGDNKDQVKDNYPKYSNDKNGKDCKYINDGNTTNYCKCLRHQNSQYTPPTPPLFKYSSCSPFVPEMTTRINEDDREQVLFTQTIHSSPAGEGTTKRRSRSVDGTGSSFKEETRKLLSPLEKETKHLRSHAIIRKAANIANDRNPFDNAEDREEDYNQGQTRGSINNLKTVDYCFACDVDTQTEKIHKKSGCHLM